MQPCRAGLCDTEPNAPIERHRKIQGLLKLFVTAPTRKPA